MKHKNFILPNFILPLLMLVFAACNIETNLDDPMPDAKRTARIADLQAQGVAKAEIAYLEDPALASLDTARDLTTANEGGYMSLLERYMILEINRCRADPVTWCTEVGLTMLDGLTVQQEFVEDKYKRGYTKVYPLSALQPRKGLFLEARNKAYRMKAANAVSHSDMGQSGPFFVYGTPSASWGQNCGSSGMESDSRVTGPAWFNSGGLGNVRIQAARIVSMFIRDGGVSGKGHRLNIMNAAWNCIGQGVVDGWNTSDFAVGYTDNSKAADLNDWPPN
jgi:hypothetical protein